ncbi:MAG: L,D-transpeptidase family protein [Pseudomonadota bacterium]
MSRLAAIIALLVLNVASANPDAAIATALSALRAGDLERADSAVAEALVAAPDFELAKALRADIASLLVGERSLFDKARLMDLGGSEQRLWRGYAAEIQQRSRASRAGQQPLGLHAVPDATATVLLAETETGQLHVVTRTDNQWRVSRTLYMSIGKNGAGKHRSGDRRTPLGIYWVVGRLEDRQLPPRYGPLAFPLDYPNAWDRSLGRSGDGIWLHGTEPSTYARPPRDSDGCLVLSDELLVSLAPRLTAADVPVIVATRWRFGQGHATDSTIDALDAAIDGWVNEFSSRRATPTTPLTTSDVFAADYPEEPGMIVVRFRLIDESAASRYAWKRLYLRKDGDRFRVVATGNG